MLPWRIIGLVLVALTVTACAPDAETDAPPAATTAPVAERDTVAPTTPTTPPTTRPTPTTTAEVAPATSLGYVDQQDSVLAVIQARDDTTRFAQLAAVLGSDDVFRQARGVTVLVPIDAAWDEYGQDEFDALLDDPTAVALLISEHLSIGTASLAELVERASFSNAMARALGVQTAGDDVTIGGATIVVPDLVAENGVVHLIDTVIEP